jgi:predicted dithiol-disulfide oxidoreductase (DUF899 family)
MKTRIDGLVSPNASNDYRRARETLYAAERDLIRHVEEVARIRRALPPGPEVPDYEFVGVDGRVRLSGLFNPHREPYLVMRRPQLEQRLRGDACIDETPPAYCPAAQSSSDRTCACEPTVTVVAAQRSVR